MDNPQREIRPRKRKGGESDASSRLPPQVPPAAPDISRVSHKSIACVACQKKRRKCNGAEDSPCSECVKLGVECIFDKNSDGRRKPIRERGKKDQELLHKLFDALKTWPEQDIAPMLQAIHQTGASITQLEEYLDNVSTAGPASVSTAGPASVSTTGPPSVASRDAWDDIAVNAPNSTYTRSNSFQLSPQLPQSQPQSRSRGFPAMTGNWDEHRAPPSVVAGVFASSQRVDDDESSQYPPAIQREQVTMDSKPEYLGMPALLDSNSQQEPLTRSALSFLYSARNRIAEGEPINDVLSMEGLDLALYFRNRQASDPHTVSTWACELAKAFVHLSFPLHMNIIHTIGTFIRWLILPCQATWEKMGQLMRPLKSQVLVPHASLYADLLHIPQLRLAQLTHGSSTSIEELIARPNWVDCNWRFADKACVEVDESSGVQRLSEAFVEHINDMRNWSLHRSVLEHYPEIGDADHRMKLHDDE